MQVSLLHKPQWWHSRLEHLPYKEKVGSSNTSRDRPNLSHQTSSDSSTAKCSAIGHSRCGTLKNPHYSCNGHKCPACSPSLVMVMSPYEWKILKCGETPQKQTNENITSIFTVCHVDVFWVWCSTACALT